MGVKELATVVAYGRGAVYDATNGTLFSDFAGFTVNIPLEVLEVGMNQLCGGKLRIPLGQEFLGNVACNSLNARMLANLIGGTTATAATRPFFIEREVHDIAANKITLAQTPSLNTVLTPVNNAGVTYKIVAGGLEVAGESCSLGAAPSKDVTFAAGESATRIWTSYFYDKTAGTSVKATPGGLPAYFKLYGSLSLRGRSNAAEQLTCIFQQVARTGEIKLGADANGHNAISFDFAATNWVDDDVVFYFPETT